MITYFVVQSYQRGKKGALIADEPKQARNQQHCELMAEKIARDRVAVVAFARSGDPDSGEWEDAVVLAQYGEIPGDLLELAG